MISIGIDVAKEKSVVCIMKPGGEIKVAPFEMLHTKEEVLSLVESIKSYDEEVRVVLEATGHYHWPITTLLAENGVFVAQINALQMKKFCSQSLRKAKTDRIDAMKIASFGLNYWDKLIPVGKNSDTYSELRTFSRQYYQYTSMAIKAKVNLSNLLDQVMPGITKLLADKNGRHKLTDFTKKYWHFDNISAKKEAVFVADFCKWAKKSGYHANERKAKEIYALSQNGIPTLANTNSTKMLVLEATRVLREIEKSREIILSQMKELAKTLPEYSVAIEMDGIGETLASRLIAEIGDVRRFHSKNAIIAYTGIDAPPYQSGSFMATKRSISKRGNKYLRKTGFEIMQSLMRCKPHDNRVYKFMQRKKNEGKRSKVTKIAGLNKFLKVYYAKVLEKYAELPRSMDIKSDKIA